VVHVTLSIAQRRSTSPHGTFSGYCLPGFHDLVIKQQNSLLNKRLAIPRSRDDACLPVRKVSLAATLVFHQLFGTLPLALVATPMETKLIARGIRREIRRRVPRSDKHTKLKPSASAARLAPLFDLLSFLPLTQSSSQAAPLPTS
jgi:hypothetical protein